MKKGSYYTLEDYVITKNGEVINKHNGRILKPQLNGKGYLRVSIGKQLMFVHRLVAQKYVPNPENKLQINHKDGNKLNNYYKNLEWVTNQENRNHAVENDLHLCGARCSWSKLTSSQVLEILNDNVHTFTELGKMYNVNRNTIRDIKMGKTWKQLKRYADL